FTRPAKLPTGTNSTILPFTWAASGPTARLTGCGRSISTLSTARSSGDSITGSHPKTSGERRVARRDPEQPSGGGLIVHRPRWRYQQGGGPARRNPAPHPHRGGRLREDAPCPADRWPRPAPV